jgi:cytochrome c-type protein NapC
MGFAGGLLFWGAFNTGMEATNTEEFCSGCHAPIVAEIQETIHYSNRSGVRAICSDCHVPHEWTDKIVRKVQASKELFAHFIGTIDTQEKFQARRAHLAEREWSRLKKNDSLECRNCHQFEYMDFSEQGERSANQHSTALASGEKTCVDCHKGIAHKLPDMHGVEGWQ